MLEGGEDPRFCARRIVIAAAEDVGNADPQALVLAQAAAAATHLVGMPECQLILAQAVTYLACAPKSNAAARAIWEAARDVREQRDVLVPPRLRSANYAGAQKLGSGVGYQYPHDCEEGIVPDNCPQVARRYYEPSDRGAEARMREYLAHVRAVSSEREGQSPRDRG